MDLFKPDCGVGAQLAPVCVMTNIRPDPLGYGGEFAVLLFIITSYPNSGFVSETSFVIPASASGGSKISLPADGNKFQATNTNYQINTKSHKDIEIRNKSKYRNSAHPESAAEGSPCGSLKSFLSFPT